MDTQTEEKKEVKDASAQLEENSDEQSTSIPDALDKDWSRLQEEWNELDQKQKQYLEKLTPHELETTSQESAETEPLVEDIENKLAEYETKSKELELLHDNMAKNAAAEPLSNNPVLDEGLKQNIGEAIPKAAQETVPPKNIVSSFTGLLKGKSPAAPEKLPDKNDEAIKKTMQKTSPPKNMGGSFTDLLKGKLSAIPEKPRKPVKAENETPKPAVLVETAVKEETKPEASEGFDEFPIPEENQPLKLKKKPGVMDKMRLLKFPVSVMVLEKIDGKKTLIQITDEIKVTPEEAVKAMEILKKGGYV
jgi:hypothetical protein